MEETVDKAVVDVEKSENSERPEESQFYSIILAFFNILVSTVTKSSMHRRITTDLRELVRAEKGIVYSVGVVDMF
jgi:hypothetical protein